jgi:hypothetical protein
MSLVAKAPGLFLFEDLKKMGIDNFPTSLQPIIQQNYLQRAFQDGLNSRLGFRAIADREKFPNNIGETLTKTRKGLKAPVTTALSPSGNTNFDNGLTSSEWAVEQYTLTINMFGDTIDLNTATQKVGIVPQFVANARTNGIQAVQSLDRLARNALYFGNGVGVGGYIGGNTRVKTTLGAAGTVVAVDDIRGFQNVINAQGQVVAVSGSNPMTVTVGSNAYSLTGSTADGSNVSTAPGGISGTLTFSANVTVNDGTAGNAVVASTAPLVLRPNGRLTTAQLVAPQNNYGASNYVPGDTLQLNTILSGVAALRSNNVPMIDGAYHCYLDDQQLLGLFRDQDFKLLYRGEYGAEAYRTGTIIELLGVRFIPTTEAPQQASLGAGPIHRAIVVGQGALIEGDFADMENVADGGDLSISIKGSIDDIVMVTRPAMDRLGQIIAQSWYWIGGFALPTDQTANTSIIPTASNAYLKRGVVIESL